jgi:D-3-phosphoglycerate dehydrogenase
MYKVLTLNSIAPQGLARLPGERYTVGPDLQQPDAILVRSQKMHDMALPPSLLAVGRAGAGVNNIPVDKLSRKGVPVFNAPGANANAVKELVIAGMLLAARNLCPAWQFVQTLKGEGPELDKAVEAGKKKFVGFELPSRTLGVIGLGAIGVQVANSALALGMRVIGFDPQITVDRAWALSSGVEKARSLEEVFARADMITVHVPLMEATRGLVNRQRVASMPDGSVILNFSRGEIVDETAVVEALGGSKLAGYVCDFPSRRLMENPKVVALPHLGASTEEAEVNCAVMVADTLRNYLENGLIRHSVNFPDADMPRMNSYRVTIANANVPNMVGQISGVIGDAGLNIADLLNKSRGDLAYTIVDLDGPVSEPVLARIRGIAGVLCVRDLGAPAKA